LQKLKRWQIFFKNVKTRPNSFQDIGAIYAHLLTYLKHDLIKTQKNILRLYATVVVVIGLLRRNHYFRLNPFISPARCLDMFIISTERLSKRTISPPPTTGIAPMLRNDMSPTMTTSVLPGY